MKMVKSVINKSNGLVGKAAENLLLGIICKLFLNK